MSNTKHLIPPVSKPSDALAEIRAKKSKALLSHREVLDLIPFSRIEIYRRIRAGSFPAPLQIGKRAIAWKAMEIFQWMDSRPRVSYAPKPKTGGEN